jgi:hypothetical protein
MTTPALDHLILFLPASPDKTPIIPSSFSKNFTLTPGGTHADGLTANTLILLADGCYLELICFLPQDDPSKITNHWWGPDPKFTGWKDWCLTTTSASADENWERVKETHGNPVEGGRKRPDGELVKWSVTFPTKLGGQEVRGSVPFFCHDKTPRDLRVPLSRPGATTHPSSALGVKSLSVIVATQDSLDKFRKIYQTVLGVDGIQDGNEIYFEIARVVGALGQGPKVILRLPRSEEEVKKVESTGRGFWYGDVVLAAPADETSKAGKIIRIDGEEDDLKGFWVEYV